MAWHCSTTLGIHGMTIKLAHANAMPRGFPRVMCRMCTGADRSSSRSLEPKPFQAASPQHRFSCRGIEPTASFQRGKGEIMAEY